MPNVIQTNQNYGITPTFDKAAIAAWKKGAPEHYSQFKYADGTPVLITYIDTVIMNRSGIQYLEKDQIRAKKVMARNVAPLKKSFEGGIDYTQPPPSVEKVGKFHNGATGFTRDMGFNQLGWRYFYFDILEFKRPLDRRTFMCMTNEKKQKDVRTFNDSGDHYWNICESITNNEIPQEEDSIRNMVNTFYIEGDDSDREQMVCNLLSFAGIPTGGIRTFHSLKGQGSTQDWAEQNNWPHGGKKNQNVEEIGYVLHSATALGSINMMMTQAYESSFEKGKKVLCEARAYIQRVNPADFNNQRETFDFKRKHAWEKMEKVILNCCSIITGKDGKPEIKVKLPFSWKGFYAQKTDADPNNGGSCIERENLTYDASGKPFTV